MRISILTWGTRGDVQPYLALAHELGARGHHVVLAVNENHVEWARRTGASIASLPLDFRALMTAEDSRLWLGTGDTGRFLAALAREEHARRHAIADAMLAACAGADAIVGSHLVSHRASAIADANGAAYVRAFTYPVEPTCAYASPFLGNGVPSLPRDALRVRTHELARSIFLRGQRADLDELRARLGLAVLGGSAEDELTRRAVPTLHLFDARVLPRPADWPEHVTIDGYCLLPPSLRARLAEGPTAPELDRWLDAGPAPLFFGFGSMPVLGADVIPIVEALCEELGMRAIVCAGWSRQPLAPRDDILAIEVVDHDRVFPRCRAAVHHGGAGTTAASLAAGVPTVVCSVFGDQALWGHCVSGLRVGATLPFQRLTLAGLSEAIRKVLEEDVRARARTLGEALRSADGLQRTASALLDAIERARTRRSS